MRDINKLAITKKPISIWKVPSCNGPRWAWRLETVPKWFNPSRLGHTESG